MLIDGGFVVLELLADTDLLLVEGRCLGINLIAVRMAVNWKMGLQSFIEAFRSGRCFMIVRGYCALAHRQRAIQLGK